MHQNEKEINYHLIALMAINGLYEKYMHFHDKEGLCYDLDTLIDFANKHSLLDDLLLSDLIQEIIVSEDLIKWQKERLTKE